MPLGAGDVRAKRSGLHGDRGPTYADFGQEQVEHLLEGVAAMVSGEEQNAPHPVNQIRLAFGKCQSPFPQDVGMPFEDPPQLLVEALNIHPPRLWGISITMAFPRLR